MSKRIRELMITCDQAMLMENLLAESIEKDRFDVKRWYNVSFHDPEVMQRYADRAKVLQYVRELIYSVETGDAWYEEEAQDA